MPPVTEAVVDSVAVEDIVEGVAEDVAEDEDGRDKEALQAARRTSLSTSKDIDDRRSLVIASMVSKREQGRDWAWVVARAVGMGRGAWAVAWVEFTVDMDGRSGVDVDVAFIGVLSMVRQ